MSTDHGPCHTYRGLPVNWCRKLPPPRVEVERNSMGVVVLHECVESQVHALALEFRFFTLTLRFLKTQIEANDGHKARTKALHTKQKGDKGPHGTKVTPVSRPPRILNNIRHWQLQQGHITLSPLLRAINRMVHIQLRSSNYSTRSPTAKATSAPRGQPAEPRLRQPAVPRLGRAAVPRLGWAAVQVWTTPGRRAAVPRLGWAAEPRLGRAAEPRLGRAAVQVWTTPGRWAPEQVWTTLTGWSAERVSPAEQLWTTLTGALTEDHLQFQQQQQQPRKGKEVPQGNNKGLSSKQPEESSRRRTRCREAGATSSAAQGILR